MTIEDNKKYKLTGGQIKDLASRFGVLSGEIGDLANLTTTDKTNLVAAINEAAAGGGGGSITELTTADYNYDFGRTGSNNGLAVWLMDAGTYYLGENMNLGFVTTGTTPYGAGCLLVVGEGTAHNYVIVVDNNSEMFVAETYSDGSVWNRNNILGKNNLKQTTGTSTTDVMSQNAATSMVFADPSTKQKVQIGYNASASALYSIAIGSGTTNRGIESVVIGGSSYDYGGTGNVVIGKSAGIPSGTHLSGAVALGYQSKPSRSGEVYIGSTNTSFGFNNTKYRVIGGVHDGQSAHDAATYGQVISYSAINGAGAPTTATEGKYVGQLYYDTTNEAMYFLKTIDTTTTPAAYTWESLGGGSSVNVVQTTGTSTTDVMSQNAVTSMVFADPSTNTKVRIGQGATASGSSADAVGYNASATSNKTVALGTAAVARADGAVALGANSSATQQGEVAIGTSQTNMGYNSSNYRLLTGLYDPQSAHDAATKGYVDSIAPSITMTTTDPGEGAPLAANHFIGVYQ